MVKGNDDAIPITQKDGIWPRAVRILENAWQGRWNDHERRLRAVEQLKADDLIAWRGTERRQNGVAFSDEQRRQINDAVAASLGAFITGDAFNGRIDTRIKENKGASALGFLKWLGVALGGGIIGVLITNYFKH